MSIHRVSAGVPTGGQFAAYGRPESDLALATPLPRSGEPVQVPTEGAAGFDRLDAFVSDSGDSFVYGTVEADLSGVFPDGEIGPYGALVSRVVMDRYGAALEGASAGSMTAGFTAGSDTTSGGLMEAAGRAAATTSLEPFQADLADGTLASVVKAQIATSTVIADPETTFSRAARMSEADVDSECRARSGVQEISDPTAIVIARSFAASGAYPSLAQLGENGYARTEGINDDLRDAYTHAVNVLERRRVDMMFTWVLHGPDRRYL